MARWGSGCKETRKECWSQGGKVEDSVKRWQVAEERRPCFQLNCQKPEMIANHYGKWSLTLELGKLWFEPNSAPSPHTLFISCQTALLPLANMCDLYNPIKFLMPPAPSPQGQMVCVPLVPSFGCSTGLEDMRAHISSCEIHQVFSDGCQSLFLGNTEMPLTRKAVL